MFPTSDWLMKVEGKPLALGGGESKANINDLKLPYAPPTIEVREEGNEGEGGVAHNLHSWGHRP